MQLVLGKHLLLSSGQLSAQEYSLVVKHHVLAQDTLNTSAHYAENIQTKLQEPVSISSLGVDEIRNVILKRRTTTLPREELVLSWCAGIGHMLENLLAVCYIHQFQDCILISLSSV